MHDPFGRSSMPADLTREDRVRLIGEAFEALIAGEMPSPAAARLLGTAGLHWLENGGDLERDHLRVVKPKSHATPARLWAKRTANARSSPMSDSARQAAEDSSPRSQPSPTE